MSIEHRCSTQDVAGVTPAWSNASPSGKASLNRARLSIDKKLPCWVASPDSPQTRGGPTGRSIREDSTGIQMGPRVARSTERACRSTRPRCRVAEDDACSPSRGQGIFFSGWARFGGFLVSCVFLFGGCGLFQKPVKPTNSGTTQAPETKKTEPPEPDFTIESKTSAPSLPKTSSLSLSPRNKDEETITKVLLAMLDAIKPPSSNFYFLHPKTKEWQLLALPTTRSLNDVWGQKPGDLFLVGERGLLLYSADRGASWSEQKSGVSDDLYAVWGNEESVFVVGARGTLLQSKDKGKTWQQIPLAIEEDLFAIDGRGSLIVVAGAAGTLLRSKDKGQSWDNVTGKDQNNLYGVWVGPKSVFAVGSGGIILRSVTQGDTWKFQESGVYTDLFGVSGFSEREVYAVGANSMITRYSRRGWEPQYLEAANATGSNPLDPTEGLYGEEGSYQDPADLWRVRVTKEGQGWIVGQHGVCYRAEDPTNDDEDQPTWKLGGCPFPDEEMRSVWVAPWGGLYATGSQQVFSGLENARTGIAERDGKVMEQGFVSLGATSSDWWIYAGLAYSDILRGDLPLAQESFATAYQLDQSQLAPLDAVYWRLIGQAFEKSGDTYQAQVAYSFAQRLGVVEEITKRQEALKICLADIVEAPQAGITLNGWKDLWLLFYENDLIDTDNDGYGDAEREQPENHEEARKELCNCQGKGPWLVQSEQMDPDTGLARIKTHLVFPTKAKKLLVFTTLMDYSQDYDGNGYAVGTESLKEEPKGVWHVALRAEMTSYGVAVGEEYRDFFFDLTTQQKIVQVNRPPFSRYAEIGGMESAEYAQFVDVKIEGNDLVLTGGGCKEKRPLKKK